MRPPVDSARSSAPKCLDTPTSWMILIEPGRCRPDGEDVGCGLAERPLVRGAWSRRAESRRRSREGPGADLGKALSLAFSQLVASWRYPGNGGTRRPHSLRS